MATSADIVRIGEQIIATHLVEEEYRTNIDTKSPDYPYIEALGFTKNLLVQVKTAVSPNEPDSLSIDEERNIKSRAAEISYEAWEAKVQLDDKNISRGQPFFRKLS